MFVPTTAERFTSGFSGSNGNADKIILSKAYGFSYELSSMGFNGTCMIITEQESKWIADLLTRLNSNTHMYSLSLCGLFFFKLNI